LLSTLVDEIFNVLKHFWDILASTMGALVANCSQVISLSI